MAASSQSTAMGTASNNAASVARSILAFRGHTLLGAGPVPLVAKTLKALMAQGEAPNFLIFDAQTGQQIDIELAASMTHIEQRYGVPAESAVAEPQRKTRGRPKLGVVGREVTLLPRHWEWLDRQRGGASAALRRLIDAERKNSAEEDRVRQAQDNTNRFIYAMAGNLEGFEEAVRALYAADKEAFNRNIRSWPTDIRQCTLNFAQEVFEFGSGPR